MSLPEYKNQIAEWEKKYGKPKFGLRRYDPTTVSLCCVRCKHIKSHMSRHHIRSDFFFSMLLPDVFAPRYIQFHEDDVRKLCDNCHKKVHEFYKPIYNQIHYQLNTKGAKIVTEEWCRMWMGEFEQAFEKWLKEPKRKRKRRRKK